MHPVILILLALAVWVMGYRFFGKFLKLGVLQLHAEPVAARPDDPGPGARWTLSAFHAAACTGMLSMVGAGVAVVWGWVPAFLWVVLGSVIAGTMLSLGTLWSTLRQPGDSLAGQAFDLAGIPGALSLFGLGAILLVVLGGVLATLLGDLLHAHPHTTWPFLSLLVIGGLLGGRLRAAAGVAVFAAAFVLGQYLPLGFQGSWTLNVGGAEVFALRQALVWALVALCIAYLAAGRSLDQGTRGRGALAAALAAGVLGLFIAGFAIQGNPIDAPRFHDIAELPPAPVLIILVLTGGALSGLHALTASGITAPRLASPRSVTATGYLGVGLDSLVAVMTISALAAGFSAREDWLAVYGSWPTYAGLYVWLDVAITNIAQVISAVGIPLSWSVGLVAAMAAALALSMLEAVLRLLSMSVHELVQDFELERYNTATFRHRCALALIAAATLVLAQTHLNLQHWLLAGIVNQWFACAVLLLIGLMLWRAGRPSALCWGPLLVIAPLAVWGTVWIMRQWSRQGDWVLLAIGAGVCLITLVYLAMCARAAWRLRRQLAAGTVS